MTINTDKQELVSFADKIGYDLGDQMAEKIEVYYQKGFDFMPDLAMFITSYLVRETFTRQTTAPKNIKDSICFFFVNMFDDSELSTGKIPHKTGDGLAYVHVFPFSHSHKSLFKKNSRIKTVSVIISSEYLKSFLRENADNFRFLFIDDNNFLIEEIMTDDIVRTINDIVNKKKADILGSYYYKLKAMELLLYLFESLSRREKSVHQKLSASDIRSIYEVRDKIVSSLTKPTAIAELKRIAGMNELKMRKMFIQVFGLGIYDYFQHLRMKEAARLLRDEKLSVSETGYQMGFENLSHFTKMFEKNIGKKPKKYAAEFV